MKDIRPCPYCGGEVEVVKLIPKVKGDEWYRIQCMRCKRTVAKGLKFDCETVDEGKERIRQYKEYIKRVWSPYNSTKIRQSVYAEQRDRDARVVGE